MTEAQSDTIFGDTNRVLAKMFASNEVAADLLFNTLKERIKHHTEQYREVTDALVLQGGDSKLLVRAAHIRGELANTEFLVRQLEEAISL